MLEDVSLSMERGQTAAVMAKRAQGKTTLIDIARGTLAPDRGTVRVNGRELSGLSARQIGEALPAEIGLATRAGPKPQLTVEEYLRTALSVRRDWDVPARRKHVAATLRWLGLTDCAHLRSAELSNWERVLVELGQAIVAGPGLLLIDDVMDGLAVGEKIKGVDLIEDFASELGCAVLMAVADNASALRSSQVWRLQSGEFKLMYEDSATSAPSHLRLVEEVNSLRSQPSLKRLCGGRVHELPAPDDC